MDTKQKKKPDAQRRRPEDRREAEKRRQPDEQRRRDGTPQQKKRRLEQPLEDRVHRGAKPEQRASHQANPELRRQPVQREQMHRKPETPANVAPQAHPIRSTAAEVVFHPTEQNARQNPQSKHSARRADMRRRSATRAKERKKQLSLHKKRPSVVYTQPMPFNLNRLLLQLTVVLGMVLAITLGLSVFFKVDKVVVYGNHAYSAWVIQEASGIDSGDNLLTFSRPRASGKIITALPYVKNARIGIKLPDTVNIYIDEFDVAYAIKSQDGTWWLMTSGGRVVEQIDAGIASGYTKVFGVVLDNPGVGGQGKAFEPESTQTTPQDPSAPTGEGVAPVLVSAADRLNSALMILASLETNDIVGEVASVDVTSLSNIELWYGQRYQVKVGDSSQMDYKISCMSRAISQLSEYQMGVLDVSFTTWPDQPGFTPFA